MKSTFSTKIVELRKNKGYTQKHVAAQIGMTTRQYAYMESGHFNCNYNQLINLCKLYSISADELLGISVELIFPETDMPNGIVDKLIEIKETL